MVHPANGRWFGQIIDMPMLKYSALVLSLAVFAIAAAPGRSAEPPWFDVSGVWRIDIEHQRRQCHWQGQVRLKLDGTRLTGDGEAAPQQGQRFCPLLKGSVEGSVGGQVIRFGFATGRLGTGEFDGLLEPGGHELHGTWSARSAAGTWRAERIE